MLKESKKKEFARRKRHLSENSCQKRTQIDLIDIKCEHCDQSQVKFLSGITIPIIRSNFFPKSRGSEAKVENYETSQNIFSGFELFEC